MLGRNKTAISSYTQVRRGRTMDAEVTAIDEKNGEEVREESCKACELMELGVVSKDTHGWLGWSFDGGATKQNG
jgi:hypothetical protein